MSDCKNYVSEEDIKALKESELHIEHVARSRNITGEKVLSVTDTIRGEKVTNRTLDGLEELYQNALSNIGYQQMGDYKPGITIDVRNQIVFENGSWYIYRGDLPHVTTGATLTEDGGVWSEENPNGQWVNVGQQSLREELKLGNSHNLGYKSKLCEAIQRTVRDKLSESVSVLDFGVIGDGIVDDTNAFKKAVSCANTMIFDLYIPANCTIRITSPCDLPNLGITGNNRRTSGIIIDIDTDNSDDCGLIFNAEGNWGKGYSGSISKMFISTTEDSESHITLLKINTPSMGSSMRDVTLTTRFGACIEAVNFFYYYFDNVVFTGKWFSEPVSESTAFRGVGFKTKESINNTYFNKCDFRFLENALQGPGEFKGSNNIKFDECVFETLGHHIGDITSWNVTFSSCYIEHLWRNLFEQSKWSELICKAGTADITFDDHTLFNFAGAPENLPCFTAYLCNIKLIDIKGGLPKNYSSYVINPITYSTRATLILDNSPGFSSLEKSGAYPAYTNQPQQHVSGYQNTGAGSISRAYKASSIADYELEFLGEKIINKKDIPEVTEGNIILRTGSDYFIKINTEVFIRKHEPHNNNAYQNCEMMFYVSGDALLSTILPSAVSQKSEDSGNMLEQSKWNKPYFLQYAESKNGFSRFALKRRFKDSTDYNRTVSSKIKITVIPVTDYRTIGISPIFN